MRKSDIMDRESFLAACPESILDELLGELHQWQGGRDCPYIEATLDSVGQIDSESCVSPAWYRVEMLDDHGIWQEDLVGSDNFCATEREAQESIESLRELGDEWAGQEYRVVIS